MHYFDIDELRERGRERPWELERQMMKLWQWDLEGLRAWSENLSVLSYFLLLLLFLFMVGRKRFGVWPDLGEEKRRRKEERGSGGNEVLRWDVEPWSGGAEREGATIRRRKKVVLKKPGGPEPDRILRGSDRTDPDQDRSRPVLGPVFSTGNTGSKSVNRTVPNPDPDSNPYDPDPNPCRWIFVLQGWKDSALLLLLLRELWSAKPKGIGWRLCPSLVLILIGLYMQVSTIVSNQKFMNLHPTLNHRDRNDDFGREKVPWRRESNASNSVTGRMRGRSLCDLENLAILSCSVARGEREARLEIWGHGKETLSLSFSLLSSPLPLAGMQCGLIHTDYRESNADWPRTEQGKKGEKKIRRSFRKRRGKVSFSRGRSCKREERERRRRKLRFWIFGSDNGPRLSI